VNFTGVVGKTTVNQPAPFDYYFLQTFGQARLLRGNGTVNGSATGLSAPSLGVPHLVSVVMEGAAVAHFLDGQTNGTGILSVATADNGNSLGIGTRSDGVTKMKGDVGEILLFDSALSAADRVALDNYFGSKYGLVVGVPPRISILASGGTATLSWPTPTATLVLESAPDLSGSMWTRVQNIITSSGGTDSVTINAFATQQFYRLRKP
jgi:hypothetical protein